MPELELDITTQEVENKHQLLRGVVSHLCPAGIGDWAPDLTDHVVRSWRQLDQHPPTVRSVPDALRIAGVLEPIERRREGTWGQPACLRELPSSHCTACE